MPTPRLPSTCFSCHRLAWANSPTFVIMEEDKWTELPLIYAKVYPNMLVLIDTGCGGGGTAFDASVEVKSLRIFIETYPVKDNGWAPLNPGGEKTYILVCTNCHFDHIGEFTVYNYRVARDETPSSCWSLVSWRIG